MSTPEPIWNPDAHLEQVYQRGRKLRNRRRWGAVAGGTVAALALVASVAGLVGGGGSQGRRVATAGTGTSPGTGATAGPSTSVGPLGAGTSGSGAPTTVAGSTGTTAGPAIGATGTPALAPSTTVKHRVTTTIPATTVAAPTTTGGPAGDCAPAALGYRTSTNQAAYQIGDEVDLSLVVTNKSGHTCNGPSNAGIGAKATITGPAGTLTTNGPAISCTATCQPPVLAPGGSTSYSAGYWIATASGNYTAAASRLGASGAATTFRVA